MDCERIRVLVPAPVEASRGAEWAANAAMWIWRTMLQGTQWLRRLAKAPGKGSFVDRARMPLRRQVA